MTFEQYAAASQRGLFRFAVVLCGDPVLAEDLVAEVLVRAYERWGRIGSVDHPHAYVRRMIVNEFVSWRRRVARTVPRSDVDDLHDQRDHEPDPAAGHAERSEMTARLARLPPKQRASIVLRFYEGLPDDQIADVLGCRPATVRSNIARGLHTLRISMTDDEDRAGGLWPAGAKEYR